MASATARSVLILSGPPGVGKTTAAATLAARTEPSVHLRADHFFEYVSAGFIEPWKPESATQNGAVIGAVAAAASAYAEAGYYTVVDGIVIPHRYLDPLHERLRAGGHEVAYAVMRAPLDDCLERLREREGILAEPAAMEAIWNEFADLGAYEGHAVDVTGRGAEEAAAALAERLDAGDLAL